jgi:putative endonuclease
MGRRTKIPDLPSGWSCYLLLCADQSYYCGISNELGQRVADHATGKGGAYTKETKPIALVWYEAHPNRRSASNREKQIKKWGHTKKQKLAEGDPAYNGMGKAVRVSLG